MRSWRHRPASGHLFNIAEASEATGPSEKRALEYRDGLIVALVCDHGPRMRNLAEIRAGAHLLEVMDGVWRLSLRETKNAEPLTLRLGSGLIPPSSGTWRTTGRCTWATGTTTAICR